MEFRVTSRGANGMLTTDMTNQGKRNLIRSGCPEGKIVRGTVFNLDKVIEITLVNEAILDGWLIVCRIWPNPASSATKLCFQYVGGAQFALSLGWNAQGTNWSLGKFYTECKKRGLQIPLDMFNEGWQQGKLQVVGREPTIESSCTTSEPVVVPAVSVVDIKKDTTLAKVDPVVKADASGLKKIEPVKVTANEDIRLRVEFRVTAHGASDVRASPVTHYYAVMTRLIRCGCQGDVKIVDGTPWNLDLCTKGFTVSVFTLNRAIHDGWLMVSNIQVDPTSTMKLSFESTDGRMTLEQYWTKYQDVRKVADAWHRDELRLASIDRYPAMTECTPVPKMEPATATKSESAAPIVVPAAVDVNPSTKDKDANDELRLSVVFRVTADGAASVNERPSSDFMRAGCHPECVVHGAMWNLDKALESGMGLDRVNQAMRDGWITIAHVFLKPTSIMKLEFRCALSNLGSLECGRVNAGTEWSLERFWNKSSTVYVCELNDAWQGGKLSLVSMTSRPPVSNVTTPESVKVDLIKTTDPVMKIEQLTTVSVSNTDESVAQVGMKEEEEEKQVKLNVEFQVTLNGANAINFYSNAHPDHPMVQFIRGGCDGGKVIQECQWKLEEPDSDAITYIERLNQAMREGWLVISRIAIDSASTSRKWNFVCTFLSSLDSGRSDGNGGWSLDRFWSQESGKTSSMLIVKQVNEVWHMGKIRLLSMTPHTALPRTAFGDDGSTRTETQPMERISKVGPIVTCSIAGVAPNATDAKVVIPPHTTPGKAESVPLNPPAESVKAVDDGPWTTDTPKSLGFPALSSEDATRLCVMPGVSRKNATCTEKDMTRKMQFQVSTTVEGPKNAIMIDLVKGGCEGGTTSRVWTLERAIEKMHKHSTTVIASCFKEAIWLGFLELVPVPPRLAVGQKGYAYLQSNGLMQGPMHYFIALCASTSISLDSLRAKVATCAEDSFVMAMYGKVLRQYDAYLALAIQQEFIVEF